MIEKSNIHTPMTSNTTSDSNIHRPLLDYVQVLRKHQHAASDHGYVLASVICQQTVKKLEALQDAYELLPGRRPGRWFLSAGYESAHQGIRSRCAGLLAEVDEIRASLPQMDEEFDFRSLDHALRDLSRLLEVAVADLSCLSQPVVIPEPAETSSPGKNLIDQIFRSIEA